MPSFDPVTPAPDGGRDVRSTSVRATRGHNTTRRSSRGEHRLYRKASGESQEPRKLNLSPVQQEQDTDNELKQVIEEEPQILKLPPSLFPHWCILMFCSSLSLAAAAAGTPLTTNSSTAESSNETQHYENLQMVMAISTLSLMLTFLASACYVMIPASFVGSLYEVTAIGLCIVLNSGNLPIVMNPTNDLAVQGSSIVNGNLFVFSWLCFFMSWALLKLVLEQAYCMDQARNGNLAYLTPTRDGYPPLIPLTPYRLGNISLILSSLVVLVSSVRSYKHQLCSDWNRQLCKRLILSMSVAVMTLIGLLITWSVFFYYQKRKNIENLDSIMPSTKVRLGLKGLLVFGWFLATALGTFGKHGPGHALGNYFFGLWISLGLSLYLFKKTLLEHLAFHQSQHTTKPGTTTQHRSKQNSKKKNRIPGLVLDDAETTKEEGKEEEEEPAMSTSCTDDAESLSVKTPSLVTPSVRSIKSSKSTKTHDTIAISLDESFRNEDPELGLRILHKNSTDKTHEEDFEDDASTDKTPKRGSSTRSVSSVPTTCKSRGSATRSVSSMPVPGTCQSTMTSASQKSDFYHERIKPTSNPFSDSTFDDDEEQDEEEFDRNGLSTSAITTAIDNTSTGQRDVLIDPEDFQVFQY